jgi:hypothetical protein
MLDDELMNLGHVGTVPIGSTPGPQIDATADRGLFAFCSYRSAPGSHQEWMGLAELSAAF